MNRELTDNLSEFLGTHPIEDINPSPIEGHTDISLIATENVPKINEDEIPEEHSEDKEIARKNMYDLLKKGNSALEDIMCLAKNEQSEKMYKNVISMIATLTKTNKELSELNKDVTVNNTTNPTKKETILITTSDMLDKLMDIKNGKEEKVIDQ